MGKRRTYSNNVGSRYSGEQRMSIGDRHVDEAITRIDKLATTTAATMASYDLTLDQTLPMFFGDDKLARAKAAKGLIAPSSHVAHYEIGTGIRFGVDFSDCSYPTLVPAAMQINPDRVAPLKAYVEAVRAVYDRFEEVKAVLRWLNRNATPGAIRYYWPTALKLCPTSPALMEVAASVPSRFTPPTEIHTYLEIIKTSAATVAASAMLPSMAKPQERRDMWLIFNPKEVPVGLQHNAVYKTDQITFNI